MQRKPTGFPCNLIVNLESFLWNNYNSGSLAPVLPTEGRDAIETTTTRELMPKYLYFINYYLFKLGKNFLTVI